MIAKKFVGIELENGNHFLLKVYLEPKVFKIFAHLGRMLLLSNFWEITCVIAP
jgi:hypothetical protein